MRQDATIEAVGAAILESIRKTGWGDLSPTEQALVGVLTTFMIEHVKLHQRVCALEHKKKGS